jgi:hypothetical protein
LIQDHGQKLRRKEILGDIGVNGRVDLKWIGYCAGLEARGGAMVGTLRYKPEGRGIDSRWCHWNFSLT